MCPGLWEGFLPEGVEERCEEGLPEKGEESSKVGESGERKYLGETGANQFDWNGAFGSIIDKVGAVV